ncbi:tRNA dihydrouridine synthase DusB [Planomonospora alba]|uniref:tRNA-dihydrouridine synthase n=1 Tax=Planomonospora alba TaxID=161354 RepID=A0ABP6NY00_9ACTN
MESLKLGSLEVWPPVVLAPMAGITNSAFRTLCREQGGGLFVCEMITTRALVERNAKTLRMVRFAPDERPRSIQLYGIDPRTVGRAVRMIADEDLADHVDLNFGCPVPKVTRRGGGSALPYKRNLFRAILREAVRNAGALPVTVKMRKGIDDDHLTYLDAGRIAEQEGVAAVALHGRTAVQHYGGTADWEAVARLKEAVTAIPVLGNGDIWSADDARRMIERTGCDGVVVGRGCLGRPWLFADLAAMCAGSGERARPALGEVAAVMDRHATLLTECFGSEATAVTDFRKHVGWYLKGFTVGADLRRRLATSSSLAGLREGLTELDPAQPWPGEVADTPRGKTNARDRVHLPAGWLDDPYDLAVPDADAELDTSGG